MVGCTNTPGMYTVGQEVHMHVLNFNTVSVKVCMLWKSLTEFSERNMLFISNDVVPLGHRTKFIVSGHELFKNAHERMVFFNLID